jgi:hypothetical protein
MIEPPETQKDWDFGTIRQELDDSSLVIESNDKEFRRNREHIKPRNLSPQIHQDMSSSQMANIFNKSPSMPRPENVPELQQLEEIQSPTTPTLIKTKASFENRSKDTSTIVTPSSNSRPQRTRKMPQHLVNDYVVDLSN